MIDVAAVDDIPSGGTLRVDVNGKPVCLVRVGETVYAVHDVCTHAQASMSEGFIDDEAIECPRHGARFRLTDGEVLTPPASTPLPVFPVEVHDGRVHVGEASHPHPFLD